MGLLSFAGRLRAEFLMRVSPTRYKNEEELAYWRSRYREEGGSLGHSHYEHYYTSFFKLSRGDYIGKRVLDIGCGPRGSLEWIAAEAECVGLDPIADSYRALGTERHRMKYVNAGAEKIPFPDGHFDMVTSFNNLDHVDDPERAVAEIKRVTAPGGVFLLITEVEHAPTPAEPHSLPRTIARHFEPEFEVVLEGTYALSHPHGIYDSLREARPPAPGEREAVFARFTRRQA